MPMVWEFMAHSTRHQQVFAATAYTSQVIMPSHLFVGSLGATVAWGRLLVHRWLPAGLGMLDLASAAAPLPLSAPD